jgi:hypothetical protein
MPIEKRRSFFTVIIILNSLILAIMVFLVENSNFLLQIYDLSTTKKGVNDLSVPLFAYLKISNLLGGITAKLTKFVVVVLLVFNI